MRYVNLSEEEKNQLEKLYSSSDSWVVRRRCQILLLSNKGNSLVIVAKSLDIHWNTVFRLIDKWESCEVDRRLSTLDSIDEQGAKVKLEPVAEYSPS